MTVLELAVELDIRAVRLWWVRGSGRELDALSGENIEKRRKAEKARRGYIMSFD